jgi:nucleotide-binding universal stress UspA family protein
MDTPTVAPQSPLTASGPVIVGVRDHASDRDTVALGHALSDALGRRTLPAKVPARSAFRELNELAAREDAVAVVVDRADARLLSASSVPVAVAPSGYAEAPSPIATVGIGFDGSENSRTALHWAAAAARAGDATLRIVAVREPLPLERFALTSRMTSAPFANVMRGLQEKRLAIRAAEVGADLEPKAELRDGTAVDVLVDASSALDLLVLGTRGLGRVRGALLGSVSTAVVQSAHCPVIVVPGAAR